MTPRDHAQALLFHEKHKERLLPAYIASDYPLLHETALQKLHTILTDLQQHGKSRIAFFGASEWAGKVLPSLSLNDFEAIIVFDSFRSSKEATFCGYPLMHPSAMAASCLDGVIITTERHQDEIRNIIQGHLTEESHTQVYTIFDQALYSSISVMPQEIEETISSLKKLCRRGKASGLRTIAITGSRLCHHQGTFVPYLKARGYQVVLLANSNKVNFSIALNELGKQYDHVFCSKGNFFLLLRILQDVPFDLVHCFSYYHELSFSLSARCHCLSPFVTEFQDITGVAFEENAYINLVGEELATRELEAERLLWESVDGIIYKDSPEVIDIQRKKYDTRAPTIQFLPYVTDSNTYESDSKLSAKDGRLHIAFIGGILRRNDCRRENYKISRSIYRTAETLTSQGIYLDVYNGMDGDYSEYPEFVELAERNPYFNYFTAIPFRDILRTLVKYDYGWFCMDYSELKKTRKYIQLCMASRIMGYMGAGLPVIISIDTRYMADFLVANGIGIPLRYEDIAYLPSILSRYDTKTLTANIKRAQNKFSMKNHIDSLCRFYEHVIGNVERG